ncbi:hypothetical protein Lal_00010133 [Lupinus albus]|nr:hypothetical protein Lal_00010133 [Lupinus albus]
MNHWWTCIAMQIFDSASCLDCNCYPPDPIQLLFQLLVLMQGSMSHVLINKKPFSTFFTIS